MRVEPKFKVGDTVVDIAYEANKEYHFKIGSVYWNEPIKGEGSKWCYLPVEDEPDWDFPVAEGDERERAPQNSYWEGYLKLVKRKVTMEENE